MTCGTEPASVAYPEGRPASARPTDCVLFQQERTILSNLMEVKSTSVRKRQERERRVTIRQTMIENGSTSFADVQLDIDRDGKLPFTKNRLRGASVTILGRKGTGKSNTLAVFMEELLSQKVPLVIVDPQDEYYSLTQEYDIIVAGRTPHALIPLDPLKAGALAEFSLTHNFPVVLSLKKYTPEERFTLLRLYFERLWALEEDLRKLYFVLLEEAHTYLPQVGTTPVFGILSDIFLQGRKNGLGTILATQRSQKIHKDTISQSEIYLLHKVSHPKDIELYEDLVPILPKEVRAMNSRLRKGSAIVMYEDETLPEDVPSDVVVQVQIRPQRTYHAGATPTFEQEESITLRQLDESLVQELQRLLAESEPGESELERQLRRQIAVLEDERARQEEELVQLQDDLTMKEGQIRDLATQVDLLSKITVSLDGSIISALDLPSALHLDTLHTQIDQATIAVEQVVGNTPVLAISISESSPESIQPAVETAEKASTALLFSEQKLLNRLITRVKALTSSEKALLTWLIEHDNTQVTSRQLADAVGMDIGVTWARQTQDLMKFSFITRSGKRAFFYNATVGDYCRYHFRSIADDGVIIQQLVRAAQEK